MKQRTDRVKLMEKEENKLKGITKVVAKKKVTHDDYKISLMEKCVMKV